MEYHPDIDIRKYLTLDVESRSMYKSDSWREDMENILPPGWRNNGLLKLFHHIWLDGRSDRIDRIKIEKGLLRVYPEYPDQPHSDAQELFDVVSQHIARKSSMMCMVCGDRGFRRLEEGSPSFCSEHYIQYLNYLSDQ